MAAAWANVLVVTGMLGAGMVATLMALMDPPPAASADEARTLAELPTLTWSHVISGEVSGAFEAYVADRVPGRSTLLAIDDALRSARGLGRADEDVIFYEVSPEALELGADGEEDRDSVERLPVEPVLTAAAPRAATAAGTSADSPAGPQALAAVADAPSSPTTRVSAGVLIRDGRAMQVFGGHAGGAPSYASALNAIQAAVGEHATVYAIIVPTAQAFYLPRETSRRARDERPNISATYARLADEIRTVDVHAGLVRHTAEDIYFRTDHHWTSLGAYYAYRAFCARAELIPVPLDRMDRHVTQEGWLGSLHRLTRDAELRADDVEVVIPRATAEVRIRRAGRERVLPLFDEDARGYEVFLGGDHPLMRVSSSTRSGRRAILVKNSYGNAFAPYLISHYEELVLIDYRTFHGRLRSLLEESDLPTDLIFLNGVMTTNSRAHTTRLRELIDAR